MISMEAFWKGRDTQYAEELTDDIRTNAEETVRRANELLAHSGIARDQVNSGWRPRLVNDATANAGTASKHITGEAVDIADSDRQLARWCCDNTHILVELSLWMENPKWTPTWVHVQIVPPRSGSRIYIPNMSPPADPDFKVA